MCGIPGYEEIKVRPDDIDVDYWVFPASVIAKTIELLKKSDIDFEALPGDFDHVSILPLAASSYDSDELAPSDAILLRCSIEEEDLERAVEYINTHESALRITVLKNSELPEFEFLLDEKENEDLSSELKEVLCAHMRLLLDMTDGDRMRAIYDYDEKASFAKLLKRYSPAVREFILNNVTKRYSAEIQKAMSE